MKKVSIIIPVYNIEQYLPRCLDSVISQTYTNLEIILVDDGSTDSSGRICDEYAEKDKRIVVIHKKNAGVSLARNDGIAAATGNYIGFVDGDDLIEKDMYEILIGNAEEKDADISICQMDTVDVNGKTETGYNYDSKLILADTILEGYFFNETIKAMMYSQCNKIFKREVLTDVRFKGYRYCEDILFVFEAVLRSERIYYDNRIGYHYIHRENSAMTSVFTAKRLDYIYAARELVRQCEAQAPQYLESANCWLYQHTLVMLRSIIIANMSHEFEGFLTEGKAYIRKNNHYLMKLGWKKKLDYIGILYLRPYLKMIALIKGFKK